MDYVVTLGYFDWRKYKMWNQKTFVENLKWLRKMNQLTQEELALKVGVSREVITKWENGKMDPSLKSVVKLAEAFMVSVDELLGVNVAKELSLLDLLSYCRQNGIMVIYNGSTASATFINGNADVEHQLQRYRNMVEEKFKE